MQATYARPFRIVCRVWKILLLLDGGLVNGYAQFRAAQQPMCQRRMFERFIQLLS